MKVYKKYAIIDNEPEQTKHDVFNETEVLTEQQLRAELKEHIKSETIDPMVLQTLGIIKDADNYNVNDIDVDSIVRGDIDLVIEMFRTDGYSIQEVELPNVTYRR